MVTGLDRFREHFREYTDQFVLIGGSACDLVMMDVGQRFRATKDLDIVLLMEKLTPDFGRVIWEFIRLGGYTARERDTGGKQYYRFSKPTDADFPAMLELFSQSPDGFVLPDGSTLTPIPIGEDVASLSAILLDQAYYGFLRGGKREMNGLPIVGAEHLMVLKMKAWLDLSARRAGGEEVDRDNVAKHKRDVFRLFPIADPAFTAEVPDPIRSDIHEFLKAMESEEMDLKGLGIRKMKKEEVLGNMRSLFKVD